MYGIFQLYRTLSVLGSKKIERPQRSRHAIAAPHRDHIARARRPLFCDSQQFRGQTIYGSIYPAERRDHSRRQAPNERHPSNRKMDPVTLAALFFPSGPVVASIVKGGSERTDEKPIRSHRSSGGAARKGRRERRQNGFEIKLRPAIIKCPVHAFNYASSPAAAFTLRATGIKGIAADRSYPRSIFSEKKQRESHPPSEWFAN